MPVISELYLGDRFLGIQRLKAGIVFRWRVDENWTGKRFSIPKELVVSQDTVGISSDRSRIKLSTSVQPLGLDEDTLEEDAINQAQITIPTLIPGVKRVMRWEGDKRMEGKTPAILAWELFQAIEEVLLQQKTEEKSLGLFYRQNQGIVKVYPDFAKKVAASSVWSKDPSQTYKSEDRKRSEAIKLLFRDLTDNSMPIEVDSETIIPCNPRLSGYRFIVKTERKLADNVTSFALERDLTAE